MQKVSNVLAIVTFKDSLHLLATEDSKVGFQVAAVLSTQLQIPNIQHFEKSSEKFHGISLCLQKYDGCINFYYFQMLFNKVIEDFCEVFEHFLSPNADIIACPQFEAVIVKCIRCIIPILQDYNVKKVKL